MNGKRWMSGQLNTLPKYPPTTGLHSSLRVLLVLGCSSYELIYFELFFDLLSAIMFFRYFICYSNTSICSSFLFSSLSCFEFCSRRVFTISYSSQLFFLYTLRASRACSYLRRQVLGSSRLWGLGLRTWERPLGPLPTSCIQSCIAIDQYRNQLKLQFDMDIEIDCPSQAWQSFFQPTDCLTPSQLSKPVLLRQTFATEQGGTPVALLSLLDDSLLLTRSTQAAQTLALPFSFDLKLQPLYLDPSQPTSSPIVGIRLFYNQQQGCSFYPDDHKAGKEWVRVLGQRLNQSGFHQLFKPHRKLGKGNFASVYEVERLSDGAKFAVKAFSKQACFSSKNGKESLINELAVMRGLSRDPHPNVLTLEGVYESDNSVYVVMEHIQGGQFHSLIKEKSAVFTLPETQKLMVGLLRGLEHLHARRYMHRDLKPENVMMRGDGITPVLVDFGLATHADLDKYLFFRCGTPGYVAPQIVALTQSVHIEPECDVFSAGVILHLLLTGQPLFPGTHYDEVFKKNKEMNIELTSALYQGIDSKGLDLLSRMLQKDPSKRIKARVALEHDFFAGIEWVEPVKPSSPCLTAVTHRIGK